MNRRSFFQGLAALMALPFLQKIPFPAKRDANRSSHASIGRIDNLALKRWSRAESNPLGVTLPNEYVFLDIDGQVLFPRYGPSGGLTVMQVCYLFRSKEEMRQWKGDSLQLPYYPSTIIVHGSNGIKWAAITFTKVVEVIQSDEYRVMVQQRIDEAVKSMRGY